VSFAQAVVCGRGRGTIGRLAGQQATVPAKLAEQYAFRDRQLAIRGQAPLPPPQRLDPQHPDGQAIARVRAELDQLCRQHHRSDHVPAVEIVLAAGALGARDSWTAKAVARVITIISTVTSTVSSGGWVAEGV
jgi:hypothetical protein